MKYCLAIDQKFEKLANSSPGRRVCNLPLDGGIKNSIPSDATLPLEGKGKNKEKAWQNYTSSRFVTITALLSSYCQLSRHILLTLSQNWRALCHAPLQHMEKMIKLAVHGHDDE